MNDSFGAPRAGEQTGIVFNIMRFALNDGPGIRTTVFFKGCPLVCTWCHNPESQRPSPEPMFAFERCIACGECVHACPHGALRWDENSPARDTEKCTLCGTCCEACPSDSRRLVGYRITGPELVRLVLRDRIVFEESGGGVTFSGGEPLMQPDFLCAALEACRSEGLHTAVDTCGYASSETFARILGLADLLLFDLKLVDPQRHRQATGVGNTVILENLRAAAASTKSVIVRIPIVPGVNDDDANIEATVRFLDSAGVKNVDLLAYHATGQEKYSRLHNKVPADITPPTEMQMKDLCAKFASSGFAVRIGG